MPLLNDDIGGALYSNRSCIDQWWSSVLILQLCSVIYLHYLHRRSLAEIASIYPTAIIGLYLSYLSPIFFMVIFGRSQLRLEDFGPFRMPGAMGIAANIISVVWMIVVMIFSTFPLTLPVTAQNMNYSIVVVAGWSMFGLVYHLWAGIHKFQVPLTNLSVPLDTTQVNE
ncbi:hypothetical protein V2G26_010197 [Clonostachys chloroleuca]